MSNESRAQELTWELKRDAWRDVEDLPIEEAIAKRIQSAEAVVREMSVKPRVRDPRAGQVAAQHRD